MKKLLATLLVLALALGMLTACGSTEIHSYTEDNAAAEEEDLFANALTAYAPDTKVAEVNGFAVYWNEYAYWLAYIGSQIAYPDENGKIDWNAAEGSEEPLGETLRAAVQDSIVQYHILESMAADAGIEFDDAGTEYVENIIKNAIVSVLGEEGTEEDLAEYLKDYYLDMDVLRYQGRIEYLYTKLFELKFGAHGEKVGDQEIEAYLAEHALMKAKHILYSFTDDEGNELDDTAKAAQLEKAQAAVKQLREIKETDKLVEKFDEIMNAESQDPGLAYYPDGYVFGTGEMMQEFEDGVLALGDYEVSDPVETTAGYHVILRLPVTGDTVVSKDSDGSDITVRYQAAMQAFNELANAEVENADVQWEQGFENLDLNKVFASSGGGFFSKLFGKK